MAQNTNNLALEGDPTSLDEITRTLEDLASEPGRVDDAAAEIELRIADLVSDPNGEVVFFNDSGARTIGLSASAPVVADGRTKEHVTAAGTDVSGYRFVTFENGPTLYFEESLDLIVRAPEQ